MASWLAGHLVRRIRAWAGSRGRCRPASRVIVTCIRNLGGKRNVGICRDTDWAARTRSSARGHMRASIPRRRSLSGSCHGFFSIRPGESSHADTQRVILKLKAMEVRNNTTLYARPFFGNLIKDPTHNKDRGREARLRFARKRFRTIKRFRLLRTKAVMLAH